MEPSAAALPPALAESDLDELRALLGAEGVLASEAARFTYEADALTIDRTMPSVVVLPRSTDEVAALVRWAHAKRLPVTARGAGTGLSGGATPEPGGLVLSVNRMNALLSVDPERELAWVQPGLVNLWLSGLVAPHGLYFAPDPASQQVSTVGGNVSTNAGGPHCLKYGVTFNHVLALTAVLADGSVATLGGEALDAADGDLLSLVVGSEGTLAIVTEICVRLLPSPESVKTMLFDFVTIEEACRAVSATIAAGIVPAALEIMDQVTVRLVEDWLHLGLATDAGAVLLVELDGPAVALERQARKRVAEVARGRGARTTRIAKDAAERAAIWRGRKSAFGAYGRAASGFYVMDGVVPRRRLAEALSEVMRLAGERGLVAGNVFHAGDGNLHPNILFDADDPQQAKDAVEVSQEILRTCIRMGGTISGEHGVGLEKRPLMREVYRDTDLAVMARVRAALNPDGLLNPSKVLPGGAGCGEGAHAHDGRAPAQLGGMRVRGDAEGPWI